MISSNNSTLKQQSRGNNERPITLQLIRAFSHAVATVMILSRKTMTMSVIRLWIPQLRVPEDTSKIIPRSKRQVWSKWCDKNSRKWIMLRQQCKLKLISVRHTLQQPTLKKRPFLMDRIVSKEMALWGSQIIRIIIQSNQRASNFCERVLFIRCTSFVSNSRAWAVVC